MTARPAPGQDAAQRAEEQRRLALIDWWNTPDARPLSFIDKLHEVVERLVAAAVAEAVKERDEKLRLRGYELTMLAQKNGRQAEEIAALQDRLAQCQTSWHSLSDGADARVAEARREERERCAQIAESWEPDGSDEQPSWIGGWEHEQTRTHIAAALRRPPDGAPDEREGQG